jgi:hypothetical protein
MAAVGDLCEGYGECNTDTELNNCNQYDVYRKVDGGPCGAHQDQPAAADRKIAASTTVVTLLYKIGGQIAIGDQVVVTSVPRKSKAVSIGATGTVFNTGKALVTVVFPQGSYDFKPEDMAKAMLLPNDGGVPVVIGDVVNTTAAVPNAEDVRIGSRGTITTIGKNVLSVKFKQGIYDIPAQFLKKAGLVYQTGEHIMLGDRINTTAAARGSEDIQVGTLGTVLAVGSDLVTALFPQGTYDFKPSSLSKVVPSYANGDRILIGDNIITTQATVPFGTPGTVTGISNTSVQVQVPQGTYYFSPESVKEDRCESRAKQSSCDWTLEFNCPGQPAGSKGAAGNIGTVDWVCCCQQGLWKRVSRPIQNNSTKANQSDDNANVQSQALLAAASKVLGDV